MTYQFLQQFSTTTVIIINKNSQSTILPSTNDEELIINLPEDENDDEVKILESEPEAKQEDVVVLHPSLSNKQQYCKR